VDGWGALRRWMLSMLEAAAPATAPAAGSKGRRVWLALSA
jgi:hypothetical protein